MVISLKNISKTIKGKKVLDNISAEFESNIIYGLVGRNGFGKTMLLRAMSGLIQIDEGEILLDGEACNSRKNKTMDLGIMIENMGLYPELNAYDNLSYLTGLNKKVSKETINKYIEMVGLDINLFLYTTLSILCHHIFLLMKLTLLLLNLKHRIQIIFLQNMAM